MNKNGLTYHLIDKMNVHDFVNKDFLPISMFLKSDIQYIGAYQNNIPVAFAGMVSRGGRGDYFNVKNCDLYLQKLYVFPEFRGKGIMKDVISHCIYSESCLNRGYPEKVALCVNPDNVIAVKCYFNCGFKETGSVRFFRFVKDYIFPRYSI